MIKSSASVIEDNSQVVVELLYDKIKKNLVEDHRVICRCLMIFSIVVYTLEIGFAIWCLVTLYAVGTSAEILMLTTLHYVRLGVAVS